MNIWFLWCHDCQELFSDSCPKHGELMIVSDSKVLKAHHTLPECLEFKCDPSNSGSFVVRAKENISKGVRFGPLDGPTCSIHKKKIDQTWVVSRMNDKVDYIIMDDPKLCNWMMYVQRSTNKVEQNLVAFQYKEHVYFVTTTNLLKGAQLYYEYSPPYYKFIMQYLKNKVPETSCRKKKQFDSIDTRLAYEATSETDVLHVCVLKDGSDKGKTDKPHLPEIQVESTTTCGDDCRPTIFRVNQTLKSDETENVSENKLLVPGKRKLSRKRKKKLLKKPSWLKANIPMDDIIAHREREKAKEVKKTETVGTIAMIENSTGQNSIMIIHPLVMNDSHQKSANLPKLSVPSIVNSAIMRTQENSLSLSPKTGSYSQPLTKKSSSICEDASSLLLNQTTTPADSCDSLSFSYPSLSQSTENLISSTCDPDYDFTNTPVGYTPHECANPNVITGDVGLNLNSLVANKSHSDSENFIDGSDIVRASMLHSRITTPTKIDSSLNLHSTVTNESGSAFGSPQMDSFVKSQISADDLLNHSASENNNQSLLSTAPSLMEVYKSLSEFIDVSEVNNAVVEVYDPNTSLNDSKILGNGSSLSQNDLNTLNSFDENFGHGMDIDLSKKLFDDDRNLTFSPVKKFEDPADNSYKAYICDTLTCATESKRECSSRGNDAGQNIADTVANNQGKITMIPVKINTQNMPTNTIFKKNWQTYYVCATCGKSFEMQCRLKRHLRSHQLAGDYLCDLCGKNFKHKSGYDRHLRTHDECKEEKKFFCSVCNKGFIERYHCKRHEVRHTGNHFVHKCVVCNKMFSSKHHLKRHNMIHEGIRPFSCPCCGRQFTQKSDMLKHFRTHPKEKETSVVP